MSDAITGPSSDRSGPLRALLPPSDPHRPVLSALCEACVRQWEHALELLEQAVEQAAKGLPSDPAEVAARGEELVQACEDWLELLRWVLGPREPLSQEEADRLAEDLIRQTLPIPTVLEYSRKATRRRPGAPVRTRPAAIAALEIKTAQPSTTWNALAQQFCDCGATRHNFRCQEALRAQVRHLKRLLRKYKIPVKVPLGK